jgi:hypothetical protein
MIMQAYQMEKLLSALLLGLLISCGVLVGNPDSGHPTGGSGKQKEEIHVEVNTQTVPDQSLATQGKNEGRYVFHLTDAPVDELSAVFIKVASLSVKPQSGSWIDIPLEVAQEINLLEYQNGKSIPLAAVDSLPAGTYQELRLILDNKAPSRALNAVGEDVGLRVPSGSESGIKIKGSFVIGEALGGGDYTVDFDLRKSIMRQSNGAESVATEGNSIANKGRSPKSPSGSPLFLEGEKADYMLKPVVRMVNNADIGAIEGQSDEGENLICAYLVGSEEEEEDVLCSSAENTASVTEGRFKLAFLPPGDYLLRLYKAGELARTMQVTVTAGSITQIIGLK